MIIDTFPYFNEKELLELRITLLKDYVDKFLIIDANRTHTGKHKEFTCKDTLKELNLNFDKVQVIELDLSWADDEGEDSWVRERAQRNEIANHINDEDYCIITDCDEIIDPTILSKTIPIIDLNHGNIQVLVPLYFLVYRGDIQVLNPDNKHKMWWASYIAKGSFIKKEDPSFYRENIAWGKDLSTCGYTITYLERDKLNGWHFSWMGTNEQRKIKNESVAQHGDLNRSINDRILSYEPKIGQFDLFNRADHILAEFDKKLLPDIIWDLPRVKKFILQIG